MHKLKAEVKVLLIALILTLVGLIVFGGLSVLNYAWIIGWAYGTSTVLAAYLVGLLLIRKLLQKKLSKQQGIWLTILRVSFTYVFQIGFILALVAIDKAVKGIGFLDRDISAVYGPINIFTYIGGVSVIGVSTVAAHILRKKGE